MKIDGIEATVHAAAGRLPLLEDPVEDYRGGPPRPFVVCRVRTEEGLVGHGFAGRFLARQVARTLEDEVLAEVNGMNAAEPAAVAERLRRRLNPRGMTGVIAAAASALDIALWDLRGQRDGASIAALLGGAGRAVPAYLTFGLPQYDRARLAEAASIGYDAGFRLLKMVVAVDPAGWREDARRVRAVADALPSDAELIIDANEGFEEEEAIALAREVADCRIAWFEEPAAGNDPAALARLRRETGVAVGAGQMEADPRIFAALLQADAVDLLQPNVLYCGGFTGAVPVAAMAAERTVRIANGAGWPLVNMHLIAGLSNGWVVEHQAAQSGIEEALFIDPPRPVDGSLAIPEKPGLGLDIDSEGLRRTRIDA